MRAAACFACIVVAAAVARPGPAEAADSYGIDPAKSEVAIHVGKAGALSFLAGHNHEVKGPIESGAVDFDADDPARSHVRLVIETGELAVTGKGDPPDDVPKVQQVMVSDQVLDVARYPQIVFDSTSIVVTNRQPASLALTITGQLTLRDATRPVTVPVRVVLDKTEMTATGHFSIKQTTYGIQPISVAGVVKVKDELQIDFSIVASRQ